MNEKQRTIKAEVFLSGIGLHTGCAVSLTLKPAAENEGICFIRTDLTDKPVVSACVDNLCDKGSALRCTSLRSGDAVIHTVEHLMAVLCGCGITNLIIEIDAQELPGLDGSGREFLQAIEAVGVLDQGEPAQVFKIQKPIIVEKNGCSIYVVPANELKISYVLDYDIEALQAQFFEINLTQESFVSEVACARTFCLESEADDLRAKGLGKGANYQNTLVIGPDGVKENKFRFFNECARHKVLDFIGDLYLLGKPIVGHIFAIKSGHNLNTQLLKELVKQGTSSGKMSLMQKVDMDTSKAIEVNDIVKILPHRYPFLLVDRILELEKGKRAVGIKNVTINDQFFQGHFPTRPVMPGVLMVEAMAQVAGVAILTDEAHHDKLAFFMGINKAKFRKVVVPGDQLVMEINVKKNKSRVAIVEGVARVNGVVVTEAEMSFSFTDASYLDE
ncbi:3-hydroxyacyl-[acyl-carrier-protein] dehydratase, FabZ form [hydrothermal vent metagenome]|uniref:3-hydroxyacyl-[acyl-carrier-protein] dehydratase, FabZ form n=1 Tax=hydrothermal vent metagenome TaxID=652676 RepID=A0A3B1D3Z0_9ZZZZ